MKKIKATTSLCELKRISKRANKLPLDICRLGRGNLSEWTNYGNIGNSSVTALGAKTHQSSAPTLAPSSMTFDVVFCAPFLISFFFRCKKCDLNGYWLPMHSNKIASPWICDKCERKIGHNEIVEKMTLLDDKIREWMLKQPQENWPELLSKLNEDLHSNHYLIFGLKKKIVATVSFLLRTKMFVLKKVWDTIHSALS